MRRPKMIVLNRSPAAPSRSVPLGPRKGLVELTVFRLCAVNAPVVVSTITCWRSAATTKGVPSRKREPWLSTIACG